MSTCMLLEREDVPSPMDAERRPVRSTFRRAVPLLAMVAGLALMVAAGLVVTQGGDGGEAAADPSAITVAARDISVVTQVYEPGQTSGWHSHAGIHAVSVTSGVLTVHVSGCPTRTYEPGRPYVGGQETHMVANETEAPVTMTVTYLNPTSPAERGAVPTGCPGA